MTVTAQAAPAGYHTVTPYLIATGVGKLIEFLQQAFQAEVTEHMSRPDGTVGHAELKIGGSMIMVSEASEQWPDAPAMLHLYVADTDAVYGQALAAGAVSVMEPADQFYGDRMAGVKDSFGNVWWLATRRETLSSEEMQKRAQESWQSA